MMCNHGNQVATLPPKKFTALYTSGLFNGLQDASDAELVCTVRQIFDKAYKEFKNQLLTHTNTTVRNCKRGICMEIPDKVKRIDVIRVERGKGKMCKCYAPHYLVDADNRLIYCEDCGAIVDPYDALLEITRHYDRIADQIQTQLNLANEVKNYKPHLRIIKELEKKARTSLVPRCPRCDEAFELEELVHQFWTSRKFLKK